MLKKNIPFITFFTMLVVFCWPIISKGYIIGGFDFLMGFYHPFMDMKWPTETLTNAAFHYKNYLISDSVVVIQPLKLFAVNAIKAGELPLWNPYILNGTSLIGNIQIALFYPLTLIYFLASYPIAYSIYTISQIAMAFWFMYLFLRGIRFSEYTSTFGAAMFAFSAYIIVWLMHATIGHAYVWLPLALYFQQKFSDSKDIKYIFGSMFALAFSALAGHMQTTLFVFLVFSLWGLYRSIALREKNAFVFVVTSIVGSLAISAIQIAPTLELYMGSVREIVSSPNFYTDQTLYLSSYLQSIAPDFFGHPVTRNWWGKINYAESAIYFSTLGFVFFTYGVFRIRKIPKELLIAFYIAIIGFILSMQNPVSRLLYELRIPFVSSNTFARFSAIYIFGAIIVSCYGLDAYIKDVTSSHKKRLIAFAGGWILILGVYWGIILTKFLPELYIQNISLIQRNSILPSALIVFVIGIMLVKILNIKTLRMFTDKVSTPVIQIGLLVLLVFELMRFSTKYVPFSSQEFFYPTNSAVQQLAKHTQSTGQRFAEYFPTNVNAYYHVLATKGDDPLYNQRLGELAIASGGTEAEIVDRAGMNFPDGKHKQKVLDIFSTGFFLDKSDNFKNSWIDRNDKNSKLFEAQFTKIWDDGLYKLYRNENAVPRAYLVYKVEHLDKKSDAIEFILSDNFDPKEQAVVSDLNSSDKNRLAAVSEEGKHIVEKAFISNQRLEYYVETNKPALFVLTDTFYPGWKAYINQTETKIMRTNWAFRGVVIPPGKHTISFVYQPMSVNIGASISGITLIGIALFFLIRRFQSK